MALLTTPQSTVGLLVNNSNPLPDASIETPFVITLAAAGTTQATGTAIVSEITNISNNTAANGVVLPVPTLAGQKYYIYPALATNAPKVYPPVGGSIDGGTVNVSVAATAQKVALFIALDTVGNYVLLQSA